MKLIVGLGNPGRQYSGTRHNAGFMVIEELARRHRIRVHGTLGQAIAGRGFVNEQPVVLLQPTTYMNRSGVAVAAAVRQLNLALSDLLVISDDLDLPVGSIRLRAQGSSGGQKGLRSIIEALNTQDFARLRIGIGRPEDMDVTDYVLRPFAGEERQLAKEAISRACDAVEVWVEHGVERAASQHNG
ncbi:MAG: aminoacyl-tRNA hydrolase [Bacillota bacterium]